jgi:hypothetical protein
MALGEAAQLLSCVLKDDALWCNCECLYPAAACSGVVHFEEGEIMSCHASIRRHFPDPSITTEDTREMSLAQESPRGSILILAGFRTEVETQLVIDRLLSEYFTPESRQA